MPVVTTTRPTRRSTVTTAAPDPETQFQVLAKELAPKLYGFEAAEEAPGGVVTLKLGNGGALRHEAALARVGQTPLEQVRRDLAGVLSGQGPIPDYLELYGGVPEILGGTEQSTTLTLPEGDYVLYCSLRNRPGRVAGRCRAPLRAGDDPAAPGAGRQRVAAAQLDSRHLGGGVRLRVPAPLRRGQPCAVQDVGPDQMHLAAFLEFPEGVDEEAALPALLGQGDPAVAPVQRVVAGPFVPVGRDVRARAKAQPDLRPGVQPPGPGRGPTTPHERHGGRLPAYAGCPSVISPACFRTARMS